MKLKPRSSNKPPRAKEIVPAKQAIASALALRGLTDEIRAQRVLTEWSDLVGAKIASRTRPSGITERTLWIEVATSAWMHELNLLRTQLVHNLIERIGEPRLFDDLKFKLAGRRPADQVTPRNRRQPLPQKPLPPPASGVAREAIVRDVSRIEDPELRELVARVRITHDK